MITFHCKRFSGCCRRRTILKLCPELRRRPRHGQSLSDRRHSLLRRLHDRRCCQKKIQTRGLLTTITTTTHRIPSPIFYEKLSIFLTFSNTWKMCPNERANITYKFPPNRILQSDSLSIWIPVSDLPPPPLKLIEKNT